MRKTYNISAQHKPAQQRGNILLVSLVLLGVLSVYSLASMRGSLIEARIAVNIQDRHLANEGAESALRAGERKINTVPDVDDAAFYDTLNGEPPADLTWTAANSYAVPGTTWTSTKPAAPRYKLEQFSAPDSDLETGNGQTNEQKQVAAKTYYRIIGYGEGKSPTASAMIESIIIKR